MVNWKLTPKSKKNPENSIKKKPLLTRSVFKNICSNNLADGGPWAVFVVRPANRTSVAQGFLKVRPGARPLPRYARHSQKCLGSCRHSSKKGHLRHQAINTGTHIRQPRPTATKTKTHSTRSEYHRTLPAEVWRCSFLLARWLIQTNYLSIVWGRDKFIFFSRLFRGSNTKSIFKWSKVGLN